MHLHQTFHLFKKFLKKTGTKKQGITTKTNVGSLEQLVNNIGHGLKVICIKSCTFIKRGSTARLYLSKHCDILQKQSLIHYLLHKPMHHVKEAMAVTINL